MKKKYKYTLIILFVLMIMTMCVSMSYAYFTATVRGNEDASGSVITSGVMALEFTDGDQVTLNNAVPGTSVEKTFKVKNTGNLETTYDLYFSEILNELEDKNDLVYTLSSETGCSVLEDTVVPSVVGEESKITTCNIGVDETHEYTLTIKFIDDNTNQDDNRGKRFSTKISVNEYKEYQKKAKLVNGIDFNETIKTLAGHLEAEWNVDDENIKEIIINKNIPDDLTMLSKVSSEDSDYDIYAGFSDGIVNLYTNQDKIYMNENSKGLFRGLNGLDDLDLSLFDASIAVDMSYLFFRFQSNIKNYDTFDTSNVTNMADMFNGSKLPSYDIVDALNTKNVTNMSYMFYGAGEGASIDTSLNASNVSNLRSMFSNSKFTSIKLNNFNAHKATDLSSMFEKYSGNSIDLGDNFNVISAVNFTNMFSYVTENAENIYFGNNFNVESNANVSYMFTNCYASNIDLGSNFNGKNITNFGYMFYHFYGKSINLGNYFDTSNGNNFYKMFVNVENVKVLDLGEHFDNSKVFENIGSGGKMGYMFYDMNSLETIYLGNKFVFNTVQYNNNIFYNTTELKTIYVGPNVYSNANNTNDIFVNANKLVGGAGTAFSDDHRTGEYARIDDPDNGKPGYFTLDPRYS